MITMLGKESKQHAGIFIALGLGLGIFTSMNIFMPLNSVDWLNKHFFKNNPISEPLITHTGLLRSMAFFILVFSLYLLFSVPENKIKGKRPSLGEVISKNFPEPVS
jgi:hypothetical protein